jgi:uncharacterized protein (TIGR00730 family)
MKNQLTNIHHRDWTETKAHSSWQIFKIMAEFVQGFETMAKVGPCVSIFGSARTKPGHKYYELTSEIAKRLALEGFGIITGGGPGIMEAANKGAFEVKGRSVGLNIDLPFEQKNNQFISDGLDMHFDYFFVRKVMFTKYSQAFIMMPGGWGTMDEFFEVITLTQTRKLIQTPLICVGTEYWSGLFSWMREILLEKEHNIEASDLEMIKIFDAPDEIVAYISDFYTRNKLQPNF